MASSIIMMKDFITDQQVVMDATLDGTGGWNLFLTPYHKLYDKLKDDPQKIVGRVFSEVVFKGADTEDNNDSETVQFIEIKSAVPEWQQSKHSRLPNLLLKMVKFNLHTNHLQAITKLQEYRDKTGE